MTRRASTGATVLKGTTALTLAATATSASARRSRRARPPPTRITPELIAAAQEGRHGRLLHRRSTSPLAERIAKAFEAKYPGIAGAGRAHRRRARVPAHRPGVRQPDPRGRRGELVRRRAFHRLEAPGHPRAVRAGGRRQVLRRRAQGRRTGMFASFRVGHERDRLQHQAGEGRRRAEELRRPARSEVDRQDGQGASGLQRQRS